MLNLLISIIVSGWMLIIFTINKVFFKSFFSPLALYNLIWGGVVVLYFSGIVSLYKISNYTFFIIILSFLMFNCGSIIPAFIFKVKPKNKKKHVFKFNILEIQVLRNVLIICGTLGIISSTLFLFDTMKQIGGFYNAINTPWLIRQVTYEIVQKNTEGEMVSLLLFLNYVASMLGGYYAATVSKRSLVPYLGIIGSLIKQLAYLSRAGILISILMFLVPYFWTSRLITYKKITFKKSKSKVLLLLIGFIMIILSTQIVKLRTQNNFLWNKEREYIETYSKIKIPVSLFWIYHYFVPNLVALDIYINSTQENAFKYTYGKRIMFPITYLLNKIGIIEEMPQISRFDMVDTPLNINTYSYLRLTYADFGIIGIIILPFLLGFFSSFFLLSYQISPQLWKIPIICYFYVVIVFSILGNLIPQIWLWKTTLLAIFLFQTYKISLFKQTLSLK